MTDDVLAVLQQALRDAQVRYENASAKWQGTNRRREGIRREIARHTPNASSINAAPNASGSAGIGSRESGENREP